MLIGGAMEDHKFHDLCTVWPHMIEDDKNFHGSNCERCNDLGEMIIQVGDAESLINEMVLSSDQHIASMGRHSGIIGMDDCFLDWI